MNANELADELDNMLKAVGLTDNRVPTMLRQQQAEIEALKELNTMLKDAIEKRIGMDAERYSAHPVKELTMTEDEVMAFWNEQFSHPIDFARAILRKANK